MVTMINNNELTVLEVNLLHHMMGTEIPLRAGKVIGLFYQRKRAPTLAGDSALW